LFDFHSDMPANGAQQCVVDAVDDWQRAGGSEERDRESASRETKGDDPRRPDQHFDQRATLKDHERPPVVIVSPEPNHRNMIRFHRAFAQRTNEFAHFHDQNATPICANLEWYLQRGVKFVMGRQGISLTTSNSFFFFACCFLS
jgi:hypothetical protein